MHPNRPIHTTVDKNHPSLKAFARQLSPNKKVQIVKKYEPLKPLANCYWNVEAMIQENGGEAVQGWVIHVLGKFMLSAMHHCIWKTPEKQLYDVTQDYPGNPIKTHSVFIKAEKLKTSLEDTLQVRSINYLLMNHPAIDEFQAAYAKKFEYENQIAQYVKDIGYKAQQQFIVAGINQGLSPMPAFTDEQMCVLSNTHALVEASKRDIDVALDKLALV